MSECRLCGDPIDNETDFCSYCGLPNVIIMGGAALQAFQLKLDQHRVSILNNISELGIVIQRYQSVKDDKVIFKEELYPLFFPNNSKETVEKINVYYGKTATFYFKTKQGKEVRIKPEQLQNLHEYSDTFNSFDLSAKINEHLKLDVFFHVKDGNPDGIKTIDNLKLGTSIAVN